MTIFLCGFMGCGKTTVGEILAKKLGLPLIEEKCLAWMECRLLPATAAQT